MLNERDKIHQGSKINGNRKYGEMNTSGWWDKERGKEENVSFIIDPEWDSEKKYGKTVSVIITFYTLE